MSESKAKEVAKEIVDIAVAPLESSSTVSSIKSFIAGTILVLLVY